ACRGFGKWLIGRTSTSWQLVGHFSEEIMPSASELNEKERSKETIETADWERVAAMDEFKNLIAAKRKFIAPAVIFFIVYYFALPALVGYAPELMSRRVLGVINLAYLFALSQFFMAWIIAALYVRAAGRFDEMARKIIGRLKGGE
ncbi:MAG: DUF485 domain-containing protein, partial [Blastocatellia bacterium]